MFTSLSNLGEDLLLSALSGLRTIVITGFEQPWRRLAVISPFWVENYCDYWV